MQIYNSLSGQKEEFIPLTPGKVGLYVCGVTVYDLCHIGHARTYTVFDVLVRFLRWRGFEVQYVRNITDIEDKIIKRAAERDIAPEVLVEENVAEMYKDFDALGLLRPGRNNEPRATETIPEMLAIIETLIQKGLAYLAQNGDVYYEVARFKEYGQLSKQNLEALKAGSRVEVNEYKRSPLDFVLWKAAKPGEPAWDSPWGRGRPGWHIECSAMTQKCLGKTFDIHGGGSDLRFPHHENEIAQSEGAHPGEFARYWMHSGMVQVNNEKMSKSLGNFFVIRDVLKEYAPEVVRYFLLSGHYRSEIHYSTQNLESAKAALTRFYNALEGVTLYAYDDSEVFKKYKARFVAAMEDDLNTPEALAVLFDLVKEINRAKGQDFMTGISGGKLAQLLVDLASPLGLLQAPPADFLQGKVRDQDVAAIQQLIAQRKAARESKNFAESDRIRDELKAQGIELEDTKDGTTWRKI